MTPSEEFLRELEGLLRKHSVELIGADYHDGVLVVEKTWTDKDSLFVDDDYVCAADRHNQDQGS